MLEQSRLAQMGEMISMIAHQWRQPLSSISAISSTLNLHIMMDNYDRDFFQERLSSIDELSQHLSSTIDNFRGFFKNNKVTEETTITNIINTTLQIIGSTLKAQAIDLTLDITGDTKINTYANEMRQVVLNILKNAEDALVDKNIVDKKITIKGFSDNENIYIVIEDNASGIPEDILDTIFDPYFSTKTAKDGTGLGLYMSKTIVEDHCQGKLNVKNGEYGAEFTIILPIKIMDK